MNESPAVLSLERRGALVTVTLNRPQAHNALDPALIATLRGTFDTLATDPSLRIVVLASSGPSFCAGADLQWMRESLSLSAEENRQDALRLADMLETVAACPCPVVARVQGAALGGGAGLVAACDIAVAAADARFGFTERRLGLAPAVIAPFVISRIGPGRARALFLTAERFDAGQAQAMGLVHRVTPAAELDTAVDEVVGWLLEGSPESARACKSLTRLVPAMDPTEARSYTANLIARLRVSDEGQEGIQAFLGRRKPRWSP